MTKNLASMPGWGESKKYIIWKEEEGGSWAGTTIKNLMYRILTVTFICSGALSVEWLADCSDSQSVLSVRLCWSTVTVIAPLALE